MSWLHNRPESEPEGTPDRPTREQSMDKVLNIGQSVSIKGELSGNEDLTIEGMVDGKILLKDHNLTIGANGRITAEVSAKTVVVIGQVSGNITATDRIEISETGSVRGDLRAPRVSIADGARFKGSVDMERSGGDAKARPATSVAPSTGKPAPQPGAAPA